LHQTWCLDRWRTVSPTSSKLLQIPPSHSKSVKIRSETRRDTSIFSFGFKRNTFILTDELILLGVKSTSASDKYFYDEPNLMFIPTFEKSRTCKIVCMILEALTVFKYSRVSGDS
jgi:hypothetical protein